MKWNNEEILNVNSFLFKTMWGSKFSRFILNRNVFAQKIMQLFNIWEELR